MHGYLATVMSYWVHTYYYSHSLIRNQEEMTHKIVCPLWLLQMRSRVHLQVAQDHPFSTDQVPVDLVHVKNVFIPNKSLQGNTRSRVRFNCANKGWCKHNVNVRLTVNMPIKLTYLHISSKRATTQKKGPSEHRRFKHFYRNSATGSGITSLSLSKVSEGWWDRTK